MESLKAAVDAPGGVERGWQAEVDARHAEAGMFLDGRPYPCVAEPLVLTAEEGAEVRGAAERLYAVVEQAAAWYLADPGVRAVFPEYDRLWKWLRVPVPYAPVNRCTRFDGLMSGGRWRVLEVNAVCPGGIVNTARSDRVWRAAARGRGVLPEAPGERPQPLLRTPDLFARSLLDTAAEQGVAVRRAAVVMLNGRYDDEVPEMRADLTALGVATDVLDARELRVADGRVVGSRGEPFDLLYGSVDQLDLINEPGLEDYLDAWVSGAACAVNPLLGQCVLGDKRLLAVVSDPAFAANLEPADRALVEATVPWTRVLRDEPGLLGHVASHRGSLVLKPANRLCGEGVVIGPAVDPPTWRSAVRRALRTGPHVVQEYCPPPRLAHLPSHQVGLDAHLFNGRFAGYYGRASPLDIMNMTAGGYRVPVVERSGQPARPPGGGSV